MVLYGALDRKTRLCKEMCGAVSASRMSSWALEKGVHDGAASVGANHYFAVDA